MTPRPESRPDVELTFLFASLERRAADVVAFVHALPRLCRGALATCDLGTSSGGDHLVCVARFRTALREETARRLEFWAWRIGGASSPGSRQGLSALRACDQVRQRVPAEALAPAVRQLLGSRFVSRPVPEPTTGPLSLRLRLGPGGPDADGLAFERSGQEVFVPSPRQPPLGEPMALELRVGGGGSLEAEGVVTGFRRAGQGGPGTPAGFLVGLVEPTAAVLRALDASVPERPSPGQRRAPRYPVRALARLVERDDERAASFVSLAADGPGGGSLACVENLSQGGAFVRTGAPAPRGTWVRLEMELPGGVRAAAPGQVVHVDGRGVGIRFGADPDAEAAVAGALEHLAAHRRRALVVDDDLLSRRMMGDALAAQGFEVFAAADGADGLRTLIDLLLGLDLVVIDLHMPGMSGEEVIRLVRGRGGERELTVVVMSGDVDPAAQERLAAAGADAVLPKSAGMARIADVAVRTMLRRERGRRPGDHADTPRSSPGGEIAPA